MKRFWIVACIAIMAWGMATACVAQNNADTFAIAKDGDALLLPVRIGDKDYSFIVDTGASMTVFAKSLHQGNVKATRTFTTPAGLVTVAICDTPPSTLGRFSLQTALANVVSYDMSHFNEVAGREIHGVLGMDFLRSKIVAIDFDRGELRFLQAVEPDAGQPIEMPCPRNGIPSLPVRLNAGPIVSFDIDTGQVSRDSGSITPFQSKTMIAQGTCRKVGVGHSETASGTRTFSVVQADSISLGDFRLEKPLFDEGKDNRLSLKFVSRQNVTFDFPRQQAYFRKRNDAVGRDSWNLSGISVLKRDGKTVIDMLEQDGPGAKAGVLIGDTIVKVNQTEANSTPYFRLRTMLSEPGTTVDLVIERVGRELPIRIELDDRPPVQ